MSTLPFKRVHRRVGRNRATISRVTYPPYEPSQPYAPPPQDHPQSTLALVLGILGFVLCGLCSPFAWVIGKRALNEIDASGGRMGGRSAAQAGYILGLIGSILLMLLVVGLIIILVFAVAASAGIS